MAGFKTKWKAHQMIRLDLDGWLGLSILVIKGCMARTCDLVAIHYGSV